ncbi:DUF29 domain-containing protein [Zavarzinia compransoris]|uniref:DUF29 domain-containing protein n=1 Tax=Zavarzinia compransoris TaxID=1264899 RepID=A0A317DYC9_9PROT|nr:DUF29 domain-containing protein [Zavarzinia compransoris]PWR18940.1 DUF29 domain-containing protein [Zavarzinia compransoris]TDP48940.1 uncharacterized protein DUF29 [Zavarzinia compransoris]
MPPSSSKSGLYDRDFYAWANEQAALLRAGKLAAADIENIAEEIESMGKTEKRELANRLAILFLHLLKWQFQPVRRGSSWEATIRVQRRDLAVHLKDNPSLKSRVPEVIEQAYGNALILAADETGLPEITFPAKCPWSFEKIIDDQFWPEERSAP